MAERQGTGTICVLQKITILCTKIVDGHWDDEDADVLFVD